MKKLIIFFTALTFISSAQIFEPVKWDFSQKKVSENTIELIFKATIDDGWYVYSQTLEILAVTNTGKVPAMTTATGVHLTETTVILGYLEKPIQHRRYSLLQQRKETKHID